MSAIVPMLEEFIRMIEADRAEIVARLARAEFLVGLDGRGGEVQQGLEQMLRSMDETRDRVAAMRAGAARLDQQWVEIEAARRDCQPPPPEPAQGCLPAREPLGDARIAAAAERLAGRVRAPAPTPSAAPLTSGDVAEMTSGNWSSSASDARSGSSMDASEKRSSTHGGIEDVTDMGTGDWK